MTEPAYLAATRHGYDAIAESCAAPYRAALDDAPLDRALLAGFAETVRREHADPVTLEVGSGHGGTAAFLATHGLDVSGIDLSAAMVDFARRTFPQIAFRVGAMHALDLADASLAALVSWYSLIHVPAGDRPAVVAEFRRVLRPGGYLLLGFQVGDDTRHVDEAYGHAVALDFHRLDPDTLAATLDTAGFDLVARFVRVPEPRHTAAPIPQGVLVGRVRGQDAAGDPRP
ncbi:class I SAM-dependent methyltransferase [Pseudonocardia pini]|uniref:class I SAM-dependent methyltransferase n=1 Tax=Pseudonocardia pini TaxID=2758030 RepID=UPI0015F115DB|nr:class I SAM-dependent methyltransferase [Pseudonocardia pini]